MRNAPTEPAEATSTTLTPCGKLSEPFQAAKTTHFFFLCDRDRFFFSFSIWPSISLDTARCDTTHTELPALEWKITRD